MTQDDDPARQADLAILSFVLGTATALAVDHPLQLQATALAPALDEPGVRHAMGTDARLALCWAAGNNRPDVIAALLSAGTDPNAGVDLRLPGIDYHNEGQRPTPAEYFAGASNHYAEYEEIDLTLRPLGPAVRNGHVEAVRALLDGGADVTLDVGAGLPLADAVSENHAAIVGLLLARGADPSHRHGSQPLLHSAAGQPGTAAVVTSLLAAGAKVDATDDCGSTALDQAAYRGDPDVIRALLAGGANPDGQPGGYRAVNAAPPLAKSAELGHAEAVQLLLDAGADLKAVDRYGRTAYDLARKGNHAAVVAILRRAGAAGPETARPVDLLSAAATGNVDGIAEALAAGVPADVIVGQPTASHAFAAALFAEGKHRDDRVAAMRRVAEAPESDADRLARVQMAQTPREFIGLSPLMLAAQNGQAAAVRALLDAGASVAITSVGTLNRGGTPLYFAAGAGHVDVIRRLLDAGADPNGGGAAKPPLLRAIDREQLAAVKLLLEAGADPNVRRGESLTPLESAACAKDPEIYRTLIRAGATIEPADGTRRTLLHNAAANGRVELVRELIDAGLDVNASYEKGTPLVAASVAVPLQVQRGRTDEMMAIFKALLVAGADVTARGEKGRTALFEAAYEPKVVALLLKHGADPAAQDDSHVTPLHLAAIWGKLKSVRLLLEAGADPNVAETSEGKTPLDWAHEGDSRACRTAIAAAGGKRRAARGS